VEEALPLQHQLLNAVERSDTAARHLRWLEVQPLRYRGELPEAVEVMQSLRSETRAAGELETLANLNGELAVACIWEGVGQEEELEDILQETLDLGERGLGTTVLARCLLSVQRARQGQPEAARHWLAEAHQKAGEARALVVWEPHPSWAEAHLAMAEGHWPQALVAFETTVDALGRTNLRWHRARTLIDWAGAHLARGEPGDRERAEELLREAEAEFEAMGAHGYSAMAQKRLGDLDMAVS
jgi:hypothetical protein